MSETPAGPGWYEDPDDASQLRYFDGVVWSSHTTPRRSPTIDESVIGRGSQARGDGGALQGGWVHPSAGQQTGQHGSQGQWTGSGIPPAGGHGPGGGPVYGGYGGGYGPAYAQRRDVLPDGAVLAEWWRRLLARILDSILTTVIALFLSIPWLGPMFTAFTDFLTASLEAGETGSAMPDQSAYVSEMLAASLPITIISLVVGILYETAFLVWRGATPGKIALGTVVRRVGSAGKLTLADAIKRQLIGIGTAVLGLAPVVGLLGSVVSVLDPAWLLWDPKRQTLHDKVADTVVVLKQR
ncbi:MAG TPA: RDD family protein [Ornithinibacter sp.]|nr:RDD family protein [Ornithinibacter sp.]